MTLHDIMLACARRPPAPALQVMSCDMIALAMAARRKLPHVSGCEIADYQAEYLLAVGLPKTRARVAELVKR